MTEQKEPPIVRWATNGISLQGDYSTSGTQITTASQPDLPSIEVKETARSVSMDKHPGNPYGIPISPALAIALIADFQKELEISASIFFSNSLNIQTATTDAPPPHDFKLLADLLLRSSAITIDKNIILKTLSQPGCEGLRFYLCKKSVPLSSHENQTFISLVTVGVDKNGQDLHYEYEPDVVKRGKLKDSDVVCMSLVSEYGSPPPPETFDFNNVERKNLSSFDDRYVLLKYAMNLIK
jgi:hypothetical protein